MKKIICASVIGNILEFYDFTLYSVFSVTLAKVFFPAHSAFASLLLSLAVFAVGFFMRPLGGIVFGYIGDRFGRRPALTFSIFAMAISTFLIGCLPGYQSIGNLAPLLLVTLRLIQGLALGGEGAGSAIFLLEHTTNYQQGLVGGIAIASHITGVLLAIGVGFMLSLFPALSQKEWRYAFMLGGVVGIVGIYLRLKVAESPVFTQIKKRSPENPWFFLIKYWRSILIVTVLGGVTGAIAYFIMGYTNVLFVKTLGYSARTALQYMAIGTASYILFLPLLGALSDRLGYPRTVRWGCVAISVFSIFLSIGLSSNNTTFIMLSLIGFGILAAMVCAPSYPAVMMLFPPESRYKGLALSFNLGVALFGGTAPMISAFLTEETGLIYAPSFYLVAVAVLFLGVDFLNTRIKKESSSSKGDNCIVLEQW